MRAVLLLALFGAVGFVNPSDAQNSRDWSVSAAQHKKRPAKAVDALFENGPERPHAIEEARRETEDRNAKVEKPAVSSNAIPLPALPPPTVQAVPPGPPQKHLTGEEFRSVQVGSTTKDVLALLGPPASRVVVPDDDGHTRETLQYVVNGAPGGTVRLDNGRVVQIEIPKK